MDKRALIRLRRGLQAGTRSSLSPELVESEAGDFVQATQDYQAAGYSARDAFLMETVLTFGPGHRHPRHGVRCPERQGFGAIGVGAYIALAGLWGSPISGASVRWSPTPSLPMNAERRSSLAEIAGAREAAKAEPFDQEQAPPEEPPDHGHDRDHQ